MHLSVVARRTLLAMSAIALVVSPLRSQEKPDEAKPAAKAAVHPAVKEPKENEMGHIHYLDYKDGFRGVKFGSPESAFGGLNSVKDSGAMKTYSKSGDNLRIGECQLDRIIYHFVNGKFMGVSLFPKDVEDGAALQQIFEIAYGNGIANKPHAGGGDHREHADEFFWKGKVANARITFSSDHHAEAWIGNNALQDEYGKIQKKMAEEAAASLF